MHGLFVEDFILCISCMSFVWKTFYYVSLYELGLLGANLILNLISGMLGNNKRTKFMKNLYGKEFGGILSANFVALCIPITLNFQRTKNKDLEANLNGVSNKVIVLYNLYLSSFIFIIILCNYLGNKLLKILFIILAIVASFYLGVSFSLWFFTTAFFIYLVIFFLPNIFSLNEILLLSYSFFYFLIILTLNYNACNIYSIIAILLLPLWLVLALLQYVFNAKMYFGFKLMFLFCICNIWLFILQYYIIENCPSFFAIIFSFATSNFPQRHFLICCYICITLITIGVVILRNKNSASTVERKYFHFLSLLVYIPGIVFDIELLCVSSMTLLILFLLTEYLRLSNAYVYAFLTPFLKTYLDKQDRGKLILTPIYLLFGLSFPIWLCLFQNPSVMLVREIPVSIYAGILSVGIGDAFASIVGSFYGRFNLNKSHKTLEGTTASFISQIVCLFILFFTANLQIDFLWCIWSIFLVSIYEAYTQNVDNLVLPYVSFLLLNV